MTTPNLRHINPRALLTAIVSFVIGLYLFNQYVSTKVEYNLPIAAVIWGVFVIIDRYLWKYPPFNWLYWVSNLSGRYTGEINFQNPISQSQDKKQCAIEVFQTGSLLKIRSYFLHELSVESSESKSLAESIVKNEDGTYSLIFTYQNDGLQNIGQPHFGTTVLRYIQNEDGNYLKGYYYTNREPQTKGVIEVKYESNKLKNRF